MSHKLLEFREDEINNTALVQVLKQIDCHATETNERLSSIEDKVEAVCGAFPNADYAGHKRYHETMIELLNERRKLRVAIAEKTISGLIWSGLVLVAISVWHYATSKQGG